ncbi:MAG: GDYXXLXY domain-containing protein, partial [Bosea sp. (in: a-proteobacteria)]
DGAIGRVPLLARVILAAALLCGALFAMIESRASILRSGTEVRLAVVPVDPRDLFRGDYVVLAYAIGTLDAKKLGIAEDLKRGEEVFVSVKPDANGLAEAVAISRSLPAPSSGVQALKGKISATRVCLPNASGALDCGSGTRGVRIDYGLESYFVPQFEGLAIERTERKRIEVVAAVSADGQSAIKRLLLDGKPLYSEPPY